MMLCVWRLSKLWESGFTAFWPALLIAMVFVYVHDGQQLLYIFRRVSSVWLSVYRRLVGVSNKGLHSALPSAKIGFFY